MALRFGKRAVGNCENHDQETAEDYVKLPSEILEANRVGESSDDERYIDREEFAGKPLASKAVRKDLSLRLLVSIPSTREGSLCSWLTG